MLTSKQRSEFRAQANSLETTLIVGKEGVTEAVIAEAERLLTARELVKGKVLEAALMSPREVSDAICEATGLPALADDSGIAVDALNGEPGIYSSRYGFDDTLDDWGRLLLLLKNTEHVPDGQRQAQFVCVISFITPDGQVIQARGEIHGELLRAPRGENGFGYDPIFYYPPMGLSTAEMSPEDKNQVSHRANALRVFYEKLKEAGYADK